VSGNRRGLPISTILKRTSSSFGIIVVVALLTICFCALICLIVLCGFTIWLHFSKRWEGGLITEAANWPLGLVMCATIVLALVVIRKVFWQFRGLHAINGQPQQFAFRTKYRLLAWLVVLSFGMAAWIISFMISTSHEFLSVYDNHGLLICTGPGTVEFTWVFTFSEYRSGRILDTDHRIYGFMGRSRYNSWVYGCVDIARLPILPSLRASPSLICELILHEPLYGRDLREEPVAFVLAGDAFATSRGSIEIPLWPFVIVPWIAIVMTCHRNAKETSFRKCTRCGYDLRGCETLGCPECGQGRQRETELHSSHEPLGDRAADRHANMDRREPGDDLVHV